MVFLNRLYINNKIPDKIYINTTPVRSIYIDNVKVWGSLDTTLTINVPVILMYSNRFNITGVLTDSHDESLTGMTVYLHVGDSIVDSVKTNTKGEYIFTHSPVHRGTHTFKVSFNKTSDYNKCESVSIIREIGKNSTLLLGNNNPISIFTTDNILLNYQLLEADGDILTGETINIIMDDTIIDTLTTDEHGEIHASINGEILSIGEHELTIQYPGAENYTSASINLPVTVYAEDSFNFDVNLERQVIAVNGDYNYNTITGTLFDNNSAPIEGETVTYTIYDQWDNLIDTGETLTDNYGDAVYYYHADNNGEVTINMTCRGIIKTVTFMDISYYTMDKKIFLQDNTLPEFYYRSSNARIWIRVFEDDNIVPEKTLGIFTLRDINYTRYTNSDGYCKLNINLPPGEWNYTFTYEGVTINGQLIVKSTIITPDIITISENTQFTVPVILVDKETGESIDYE